MLLKIEGGKKLIVQGWRAARELLEINWDMQ